MTKRWIRPRASCPKCGKGGAAFVDPQLARLVGTLIAEHGVEGPALSVKCVRCRTTYVITLAEIADPVPA